MRNKKKRALTQREIRPLQAQATHGLFSTRYAPRGERAQLRPLVEEGRAVRKSFEDSLTGLRVACERAGDRSARGGDV